LIMISKLLSLNSQVWGSNKIVLIWCTLIIITTTSYSRKIKQTKF
jgi:hypothetical protein